MVAHGERLDAMERWREGHLKKWGEDMMERLDALEKLPVSLTPDLLQRLAAEPAGNFSGEELESAGPFWKAWSDLYSKVESQGQRLDALEAPLPTAAPDKSWRNGTWYFTPAIQQGKSWIRDEFLASQRAEKADKTWRKRHCGECGHCNSHTDCEDRVFSDGTILHVGGGNPACPGFKEKN